MVSAVIADGPPSRLLEEARAGSFDCVVPDLVLDELGQVLASKFEWPADRLRELIGELLDLAPDRLRDPASIEVVTGDPADDHILACALEAGVDVLATGDRAHLLPLTEHRGVRILTPQALLAELRAAQTDR